ncbi:hypothetical protein L204_105865 [Cryptococcus depauperatus]|nr:hypothetical protein L204_06136 [Cryptococcus depauperatus CBS 7855]
MALQHDLATELELISSSLLPAETLHLPQPGAWPQLYSITSTDSNLSLAIAVNERYMGKKDVKIEVKGDVGREEASKWERWILERMREWDEDEEYPLYQILTAHFLPLLTPKPIPLPSPEIPPKLEETSIPFHALLVSHHLISPTKRKNLIALSSSFSLVGFSKIGHPGILYAIGNQRDLEEWTREVKSWNWLALRVRLPPCPIPEEEGNLSFKGQENGARGGKGRGKWIEVEKIGQALEWLRDRGGEGRVKLLVDMGVGGAIGRT